MSNNPLEAAYCALAPLKLEYILGLLGICYLKSTLYKIYQWTATLFPRKFMLRKIVGLNHVGMQGLDNGK